MSSTEDPSTKSSAEPSLEDESKESRESKESKETKPSMDDIGISSLEHHPIAIIGGGIGGLVLALCLNQVYNVNNANHANNANDIHSETESNTSTKNKLPIHVYESTKSYTPNAGGAIGLYPNGLRVLRHLSTSGDNPNSPVPNLLSDVRAAGCDYIYRRWMRHDGTEVAVAREDELLPDLEVGGADGADSGDSGGRGDETTNEGEKDEGDATKKSINAVIKDEEGKRADQRPRGGSFRQVQQLLNFQEIGGSVRKSLGGFNATLAREIGEADATDATDAADTTNATNAINATIATETKPEDTKKTQDSQLERSSSFGQMLNLQKIGGSFRNTFSGFNASLARETTTSATPANATANTNGNASTIGERTMPSSRPSLTALSGMLSLKNLSLNNANVADGNATDGKDGKGHNKNAVVDKELLSIGIRRWKYQQVLYEACVQAGIHVHFDKRLQSVDSIEIESDNSGSIAGPRTPLTLLHFKDQTKITTSLLIGADGINSRVRSYVTQSTEEFVPEYTGVTCLMGCANVPRIRGICFPSSATTKCHACYYPTRVPEGDGADCDNDEDSQYEQVFQIYFPSPIERPDTWRTLTPEEAKDECRQLAQKLRADGWDEQFLKPLEHESLTGVLRVGLRSREALDVWHVGGDDGEENNDGGDAVGEEGDAVGDGGDGNNDDGEAKKSTSGNVGRAVLLGDAAHPPVPYIGQGAMMAMEDAGTLALLLAKFCPLTTTPSSSNVSQTLDFSQFSKAMEIYEQLRVPRTKAILGSSVQLGKTQQKRADSKLYNAWREWSIKAQVWAYGTLPVMRPGAAFDYRKRVEEVLGEDGVGLGA